MEANPFGLPPQVAPLMSIDVVHSLIGVSFLAVWAMIGQIVIADRM